MWDVVSKETVCSVLAHDNAISALCVSIFGKWCKNALRIKSHSYLSDSPLLAQCITVTSHINCIAVLCLINMVYLMACAFIRS